MQQDETNSLLPGQNNENSSQPNDPPFIFPPKPAKEDKKINVWIRSLTSLALYILVGYYFFKANWTLLLILTAIVIFHELGHFLAMKIYNYKELGIFFIPLLGAYASGTKREISQKQSAVILLAGPIPGIIVGLILLYARQHQLGYMPYWFGDLAIGAANFLIFLNLLNLLPIYPLDGGQLLNRLFLEESNILHKIFIVISALVLGYFSFKLDMYVLLIFPLMMLFRLGTDSQNDQLTKDIESRGINLEKTYEELTDEEYWKIRNILIEKRYPTLRNINPAPPYEYSADEKKVIAVIESLLQRSIIQDLSWGGKLVIILIWIGCFAIPFLVQLSILRRLVS